MSVTVEQLEMTLAALRQMRRTGAITDIVYAKEIVKLAAEYVTAGLDDEALVLLQGLPPDYFVKDGPQYQQMLDDTDYCATAYFVAQNLKSRIGDRPPVVNVPAGVA